MNFNVNKNKEKLKKLEEQLEKETKPYKKAQLETKIFEFKQKHFPKYAFVSDGKTYKHY